jgi:hypothetical protein
MIRAIIERAQLKDVAYWHFSDVAGLTDDVRSWGQSGLTTDIAETTRMTQAV